MIIDYGRVIEHNMNEAKRGPHKHFLTILSMLRQWSSMTSESISNGGGLYLLHHFAAFLQTKAKATPHHAPNTK